MTTDFPNHSRRRSARWLLLLLVITSLFPEIFIWAVVGIAGLQGCESGKNVACDIGPLTARDMIEWSLTAAGIVPWTWRIYFYLAVGAWLIVCFIVLIRGWTGVTSRLLIGSAVTALFALLSVVGPWFAIDLVADKSVCKPQTTGCLLFGGAKEEVKGAFQKANLGISDVEFLMLAGMIGIFIVFAIFVITSSAISVRRTVRSERAQS